MPSPYKTYPAVVGLLLGLVYLAWSSILGSQTTTAESELLVRPPESLRTVYAGQLDRYIANEIGVMLSGDTLRSVATAAGSLSVNQVAASTTAAQTPGTDVVVVRVQGLGADLDGRVNQLVLQEYSKSVAARAQQSVAQQTKDLNTQLDTVRSQIDDLSRKIGTALNVARGRSANQLLDPTTVAPVESSQRSLLVAQYTNLQAELTSLTAQQQNSAASVQIVQQPTSVALKKPTSIYAMIVSIAAGAVLGLAFALIHIRLRPTIRSWEEVERIMAGRQWVALDSRVPMGIQMPNPAMESLAAWLGERGRGDKQIQMLIAEMPGHSRLAVLAREATEKAVDANAGARIETRTVRNGASPGGAEAMIVPYKSGKLQKKQLQDFVQHVGSGTVLFVVEA